MILAGVLKRQSFTRSFKTKAATAAAFFLVLLAAAAAGAGPAKIEASDFVARVGGEWKTDAAAVRMADTWTMAASSELTLKLRADYDPFKLYADVSAAFGGTIGSDDWDVELGIDRLYLKALLPAFDLSAGKQVINWGVGYAWSPVNLFSRPNPMGDGEPEGIPAVVVKVPVGPLDYWSLVAARLDRPIAGISAVAGAVSGAEGAGDGYWRYGVRRRGVTDGTDWAASLVVDRGVTVLGAEVKGDLEIGWHAEAAWFIPRDGAGQRWEGLLGADYSWLDGRLLWLGEFFVNSAGASSRDEYDLPAYLRGDLGHLGRYYAFNQLTYQLDDFTSFFGSALTSMVDYSTVWTAGTRMVLQRQWNLSLVGVATTGDAGDEFAMEPDLAVRAQLSYSF